MLWGVGKPGNKRPSQTERQIEHPRVKGRREVEGGETPTDSSLSANPSQLTFKLQVSYHIFIMSPPPNAAVLLTFTESRGIFFFLQPARIRKAKVGIGRFYNHMPQRKKETKKELQGL